MDNDRVVPDTKENAERCAAQIVPHITNAWIKNFSSAQEAVQNVKLIKEAVYACTVQIECKLNRFYYCEKGAATSMLQPKL
jgi:hypothetical protein